MVACGGTTVPQTQEPAQAVAPDPAHHIPAHQSAEESVAEVRALAFFERDSAVLSVKGREVVAATAAWMKHNPKRHALVHGYTSDVGPAGYNHELGLNRAQAVRDGLVANGIDSARISVVSHGENGPELPSGLERRAVFVADAPM